jgi:glycosyltransferase involved in cell wall biosynthesis
VSNLSPELQSVAHTALKLAAGATVVDRTDGLRELYCNGLPYLIPESEFQLAVDVLSEVEQNYYQANGVTRPYNNLHIATMIPILESALVNRLNPVELKVCVLLGDASGCAYWRCKEPARMLKEKYGDKIYIEVTNEISFQGLLGFDAIVVQRGLFGKDTPAIMAIIERLKNVGKKIIYEVDDDLNSLLQDNNCFYFMSPVERQTIEWLKARSDAIFTTTEQLKSVLGHPDKTYVLPNSIDINRVQVPVRTSEREEILFVLWHGGDSHEPDILWMAKPLIQLISKREAMSQKIGKEIIYGAMGYFPSFLEQFMQFKFPVMTDAGQKDRDLKKNLRELTVKGRGGVKYIRGVKVEEFHNYLAHLQPDICYVPLLPTRQFNFSKSNIKALESIVAGAATVVSDIGPYSLIPDDAVLKAKTPEQMCQGIQKLILSPEDRQNLILKGQNWVINNYDLRDNVKLWYNALYKIVKGVEPETKVDRINASGEIINV